jgi:hypothetical protein
VSQDSVLYCCTRMKLSCHTIMTFLCITQLIDWCVTEIVILEPSLCYREQSLLCYNNINLLCYNNCTLLCYKKRRFLNLNLNDAVRTAYPLMGILYGIYHIPYKIIFAEFRQVVSSLSP